MLWLDMDSIPPPTPLEISPALITLATETRDYKPDEHILLMHMQVMAPEIPAMSITIPIPVALHPSAIIVPMENLTPCLALKVLTLFAPQSNSSIIMSL